MKEEKIPYSEEKQIFYNMAVPGGALIITFLVFLLILEYVNGELPHSISMFGLILIILASFRMIRGATHDKVLRYVREYFKYEKRYLTEGGQRYVIKKERGTGWKKAINETIECVWCTGFWTTLIVIFLYFLSSATWILILLFAVSGAATFIQLTISLIATKYEELDMKNDRSTKNDNMG